VNSAPDPGSHASSSACASPVKGQSQGQDATSPAASKQRSKDHSSEIRAKYSSTDKHEGSGFV